MKRVMIIAGCLLLATPAFAQSIGEKTGVNSTLGISPTTPDFVKEVAMSDMFELATNKVAAEKGNPAEKAFATQMIADHTKSSTELKNMIPADMKTPLPTALDSSHQSKLDKLNGLNGKDFSDNFASVQVDAHKDAVNLFDRYSKGGDNPELKTWAGTTLPTLQHHLDMAQKLDK